MKVSQLLEVLKGLDPDTEVRVPYGDEIREHDYVTAVYCWGGPCILLTCTRPRHDLLGDSLWEID